MAYARISSVSFAAGHEREGEQLERELLRTIETQPGYITGMLLRSITNQLNVTRITFWNSHRDADNAGQTEHIMALRSQIRVLSAHGERQDEDSLEVIEGNAVIMPTTGD